MSAASGTAAVYMILKVAPERWTHTSRQVAHLMKCVNILPSDYSR